MKMLEALTTENIDRLDMIGLGVLAEKFAVFVDAVAADIDRRRSELLREKHARELRAAILGEAGDDDGPRPRLFHYGKS